MSSKWILIFPALFVALGFGIFLSLPVLFASLEVPQPKTACRPNLTTNVRRADMILIGRVDMVLESGTQADVWIQPDTWFKGTSTNPFLHIIARAVQPGQGKAKKPSSDIHFASGQPPYLLFLRGAGNGKYLTSKCWGSRALGKGLTAEEEHAFRLLQSVAQPGVI